MIVGKGGVTPAVMEEVFRAFEREELIKVKFTHFKLKDEKDAMAAAIAEQSGAFMAGMVGHTALFYKQAANPEDRKITIPEEPEGELVGAGSSRTLQRASGK